MRIVYLVLCCALAGCTSSSRLANPLGLDMDPLLRLVDGQRPVEVIYPAGAPRTSLADSYGPEWEIMRHGYPPYKYEE
ncbi:MAG: hypothetical protein ABFS09_07810 [Thermodesulfobacteriota bacterium]